MSFVPSTTTGVQVMLKLGQTLIYTLLYTKSLKLLSSCMGTQEKPACRHVQVLMLCHTSFRQIIQAKGFFLQCKMRAFYYKRKLSKSLSVWVFMEKIFAEDFETQKNKRYSLKMHVFFIPY